MGGMVEPVIVEPNMSATFARQWGPISVLHVQILRRINALGCSSPPRICKLLKGKVAIVRRESSRLGISICG